MEKKDLCLAFEKYYVHNVACNEGRVQNIALQPCLGLLR